MIGDICKAFVEALRASEMVEKENISVVLANDNGEGTVNTALPAVAVCVKNSERDSGMYIGGVIENDFIVQLAVITAFDNQAASADVDHQYDQMNLAYKIMMYIAKCQRGYINSPWGWKKLTFFDDLRVKYNFSLTYKGTETESTRGMQNEMQEEVFVTRLIYVCKFTSKELASEEERPGAILQYGGVHMDCGCNTIQQNG